MRQAVSQAAWHVAHRRAFGGALLDKPLMANVMADLEIETESATLMMLQLARAFDEAPHDPHAAAFRRIATPIAKYWVSKRCTGVVREAMECLGGNGYVEESMMPRLFRESPLNAIWEGSGNVIALDTVRAIGREPESLEVFIDEIATAHGADIRLDAAIEQLRPTLAAAGDPEGGARRIVETLATLWAASLMVRYAEPAAADAFVTSRIAGAHGTMFGTLPPTPSLAAIARSAVPEV